MIFFFAVGINFKSFCSKRESSCLLDLPGKLKRVDYEKVGSKAGILYDADKQCEMIFGTGSKFCKQKVCCIINMNIIFHHINRYSLQDFLIQMNPLMYFFVNLVLNWIFHLLKLFLVDIIINPWLYDICTFLLLSFYFSL